MQWQEWSEFAEDETYWQNHLERGLLKASHVKNYVLQLWFEEFFDVSIYELDFYSLIVEAYPGEALLPLRDSKRFQMVKGDYSLMWLNPETYNYDEQTIDLAPECVRFFCEKYGKKLKISSTVS